MQHGVHVNSLPAIDGFRSAVCLFQNEASQALASVLAQVQHFVEWLKHDQVAHWQRQIRRREEQLAEAKADLHRCLSATIDPRHTPSCYQEKKLLAQAKRRLEDAEQKLVSVRRWIPLVEQAVFEFQSRAEPLATSLASDVPRSLAELDRAVAAILAYLELAPPAVTSATPLAAINHEQPAGASERPS